MKKRGFNVIDVFAVVILVACVAGIAVRAFKLADTDRDNYQDCRVSFTCTLDQKQIEAINAGISFKDKNGAGYKLLEGYWIKEEEDKTFQLSGELLTSGRFTEKGFESSGGFYYKKDVITLTGAELTFDATVTGFAKQ